MNTQTIDQAYSDLQSEVKELAGALQAFAAKLQKAADGDNQQAREWLLDLKTLALAVKSEQVQVQGLLSAIHAYVNNQHETYSQQIPQYKQQYVQAQPRAGGLGGFLHSGFGRAIEMGAGFGLGDDLINSIFR